jgi:hypothetical protein
MIFSNERILWKLCWTNKANYKDTELPQKLPKFNVHKTFMKNSGLHLLSGKSNIENNVNVLYGQCGHTRRQSQWSYRSDIYLQQFKNLYCRLCPISQYEWPLKLHSCLFKMQRWQLTLPLCYSYSQVWNNRCDGEIEPIIFIINLNTVFPHLQELLLGYNKYKEKPL